MAEIRPLEGDGGPAGGHARFLTAVDGIRIRLGHWPAPEGGKGHVLILPGRTEYIEKYGLVARDLHAAGWGSFALDWRGQGLADRAFSDGLKGHVGDFAEFQRDLDVALDTIRAIAGDCVPWLAHSMGGCIALRGLVRGKTPPAIAFSAPMLGLSNPAGQLRALGLLAGAARLLRLDTGYAPTTGPTYGIATETFERNTLTTDPEQYARMKAQIAAEPRFGLGGPSLRWMGAALREMSDLAHQPSPAIPALFGLGGDEGIVAPAAIRARVANWHGAELVDYPGARHELLMERAEIRDDFLARTVALFDRHRT
ncbi:alpha/beta hydrolase [Rhodobacter sp. NTK016B]|uniref:alpha/beta fold hydrolase n=1 Tax=Rhodobacter sp. NTK016B TaxID=2759676 RepID=UPI001A8F1CB8|nr:alpha/beta hydrolase [Rhodobacter sp. NTK016B]MBN8294252.1 alpha/beta hydrolase [Rhodobacter sp. NTK016B]